MKSSEAGCPGTFEAGVAQHPPSLNEVKLQNKPYGMDNFEFQAGN
jgi:hypothetical protein